MYRQTVANGKKQKKSYGESTEEMQRLWSRGKKSSEGHDRKSKIKSHAKDEKNSKASYKSIQGTQ